MTASPLAGGLPIIGEDAVSGALGKSRRGSSAPPVPRSGPTRCRPPSRSGWDGSRAPEGHGPDASGGSSPHGPRGSPFVSSPVAPRRKTLPTAWLLLDHSTDTLLARESRRLSVNRRLHRSSCT